MTDKKKICICICTYKRPDKLAYLLAQLQKLETAALFNYNIIVVDNDRSGSAQNTVETWWKQSEIPITYCVEPEQNIARARNKAVEQSGGDYLAFIDDDEYPEKRWLLCLYDALQRFGADGILGPVVPTFIATPPRWVIQGHFFERPVHKTGQIMDWRYTRTGNALLNYDVFLHNSDWFNLNYGSGGEDREFFKRKIAEGFTFIWCNEALVYETIPAERWERSVLLKRALLRGKVALTAAESKTKSVLISLVAVIIYTSLLPATLFFSHHLFMRYLIKDFDHLGKILACLGLNVVKEKYISS